ncbi:MAG: hypothetical protein K6E29_09355 [Cyanobacteria bacterium RUI128]|nr:hypothetical protein [Cyanobacteria bacterium RUI128]
MSFEYIVDKQTKKLNKDQEDYCIKRVVDDFEQFDRNRSVNTAQAQEVINEVFFKNKPKASTDKNERWKSKIKMCKTYMFYQVLKAFIWKNVYANVNSMFDVSGENLEANNDSNKQKAMLVDILEKMEFQKTCDKVIDNAILYGEMISMSAWKKQSEEVRRPIKFTDLLNQDVLAERLKGHFYWTTEKPIYDNPYVYPVNPANFVYDVTQKDNWEECPKIYRSWKTPNDIINNKFYNIKKEDRQAIRDLVKQSEQSESQRDESLQKEDVNGRTVEVLEHWGNFTLQDGTVLKNWHIVVVGKKFLVRFAKNNRILNPFSYGAFVVDPETKRGISPLYCVLDLAHTQEDLMNRTVDMQSLSENPPLLAPEGFFDEEEIKLYPGKIIEYEDNLSSTNAFKQVEFNNTVFLNDITYISDLMAEISGIFPNMAGADESRAKTATEISTKAQGQLTRLSMLIDIINQDFVIPVVKKVAKLCADFKSGTENILIDKGSDKEIIQVDDKVRQAEYRYTYSDRTATTERSNKADIVVNACKEFAQFIPLNGQELFTWYMEQKDVENPERFLQNQNLMPVEMQDALMQRPEYQQLAQAIEMQKENEASQEPQQFNSDASIPEAQPME